jgi:D-serine deaminase-like pyridoxal phosphate-dependent protein
VRKNLSKIKISAEFKGFPLSAHGQRISRFLGEKPNLFTSEFQFPMMVLKESALNQNIGRMAKYCAERGVSLAPHVKTPMSPQLAQRQIDAGAWALTVANFAQASVFLNFGFKRLIIGNEVLEPTSIREIAKLNAQGKAEIIFYIDSLAALEIVEGAVADQDQAELNIFLEIGADGGRAGIRDLKGLEPILLKMSKNSKFRIRGVSGFEGAVPDGNRKVAGIKSLRKFLSKIVAAAEIVAPYMKNDRLIISGGGSSYFDYVIEEFKKYKGDAHLILRSGGYVSHDHIHYENMYPFMQLGKTQQFLPALEIWSRVLSVPEKNLAILNFGKRDAGIDLDNPLPIKIYSKKIKPLKASIQQLNDQHAFMKLTPGTIQVGDIVACGISHPCTNFDKWRLIPLVDDNYNVIDLIHTFF